MSTSKSSSLGGMVRLAPWQLRDLPAHHSIPESRSDDASGKQEKPLLLRFLLAILDEGASFLSPEAFESTFTPVATKPAPPSTAPVEVHKRIIDSSTLSHIQWSSRDIHRSPPTSVPTENWFSRRSRHQNISSKEKPGTASWDEFVFGLRDNHSKHECDFTPTLYDAHHILDWNGEMRKLESEGSLGGKYSTVTMGIYEMCHSIPSPLQPRCFPVLVVTASTSATSFLAVTVPVDLSSLSASFYSSRRNTTKGTDAQQRKTPVLGVYTAVETVRILDNGEIEWTMATASDACGILPMWVQKMSMPATVVKDVSYFTKWISTVANEEMERQ